MAETYFDQLGLSPTSDIGRIESAYRKKKAEVKFDPVRLRTVEQAYRVLGNPISLKKYLKDMGPVESQTPISMNNPPPAMKPGGVSSVHQADVPDHIGTKRHATTLIETDGLIGETPPSSQNVPTKSGRKKTEIYEPETIIARPPYKQPGPAAAPVPAQKRKHTEIIDDVRTPEPVEPNPVVKEKNRQPTVSIQTPQTPQHNTRRAHVVYEYGGEHKEYELKDGKNIIGRPPMNGALPDIPLPDPELFISRCHAVITINGNTITLMDSSSNGTSVNGKRIPTSQPFPLNDEDVIEIEKRRLLIHIP
jgi:hypothetical protein